MNNKNSVEFVNKISPELFLSEILSQGYERIGFSNVFEVVKSVSTDQAKNSFKVDVCHSLDGLEVKLSNSLRPNLMIDSSLVAKDKLEEILEASSMEKNIILIK